MEIRADQLLTAQKSSILWTLAADLYRFHGRSEQLALSVFRPGGGQYFCLQVESRRTGRRFYANLGGTSTGVVNEAGHHAELFGLDTQGTYLAYVLQHGSRALMAKVEAALRFGPRPAKPEKTDAPALCFRAIATLMRQRAGWETLLLADSGLGDSSGMDGVWVQDFVKHFPDIHREATEGVRIGTKESFRLAQRANAVWQLSAGGERTVAINTETAEAVLPGGERFSLWSLYETSGRDVWPVAGWLDERV